MARALGFDLVDLVSLRRSLSYLNNKINGIDVATPDTRHGVTLPVLSSFPSPPPPLAFTDGNCRLLIDRVVCWFFFVFSKLIQSRLNLNLNFDWRLIGDDGVLMANVYMNLDSTHYALPLIFTVVCALHSKWRGKGGRWGGGLGFLAGDQKEKRFRDSAVNRAESNPSHWRSPDPSCFVVCVCVCRLATLVFTRRPGITEKWIDSLEIKLNRPTISKWPAVWNFLSAEILKLDVSTQKQKCRAGCGLSSVQISLFYDF